MMRLLVLLAFAAGCSAPPATGVDAGRFLDAFDAGPQDPEPTCLPAQAIDLELADAGRVFLFEGPIGGELVPRLAFDNLWRVWSVTPPADPAAAIRERYGFVRAPFDNGGLPMGFRASGGMVRADCLICHVGEVAGEVVVGAANTRVDLELFVDDLKTLARQFGMTPPNPPVVRTGARGVSDIIGMTIQLGVRTLPSPPPVNTEIGYQDAQAWWTLRDKTRVYTDGSGPQEAHRTFMATQLAFGTTQAALESLEPQYVALREYLLTLTPPRWPFAEPPADAVVRGRSLFRQRCASCHRDDRCERSESTIVSRAMVGTDPERSLRYGASEVALINLTWFGATKPHQATAGYLAPSLRGVWASAPYLHNGSVPTLEGVLDSTKRPKVFRVRGTGRADYDEVAVGLRVDELQAAPVSPPRADRSSTYDTTKAGLGNGGHLFGDALTATERADLLHFLKTQ